MLRDEELFSLASSADEGGSEADAHLLVGDLPKGEYEVVFFNDYRRPYGQVAYTFSVREKNPT